MQLSDSLLIGFVLILLGLLLGLLTLALSRYFSQGQASSAPVVLPKMPLVPVSLASHSDAILAVAEGGRLLYANELAREWFGNAAAELNLERLARRCQPVDSFLSLCAVEGQARFALDGMSLEGRSYKLPDTEYGGLTVVTLRRPEIAALTGGDSTSMEENLRTLTEFSREMSTSLDLDLTIRSILENVGELIKTDFAELNVWDADEECLKPYRFTGSPGEERRLVLAPERYHRGEGYSGYLMEKREPLFLPVIDASPALQPLLDRKKYPFHSYLGVPLMAAGDFVGTLELAAYTREHFSERDLNTLQFLSSQAAVALHNAMLYHQARQQTRELTGLARLSEAISSVMAPEEFFSRLVEALQPIFDVEVLGFLMFNELRGQLRAQAPFQGIPLDFLDFYQAAVSSGSEAERLILARQTIHAAQAADDPRLKALGIDHAAQAAGLKETVLEPIPAGGRSLGFIQLANKRSGVFSPDDFRMLEIVAAQVGAMLENARLLQESRQRARRSEAQRRIASLAGSTATLDEILKYSFQELLQQLDAEFGAIFLLDDAAGVLCVHQPSLLGISYDEYKGWGSLPIDDPQFASTVTSRKRGFITGRASQDRRILMFFQTAVEVLGIESILDIPIIVRERGAGEIILCSRQPDHFSEADSIFLSTASDQMAGAIERANLYSQTDDSLRRRVEELTALNRISRELNASQELEPLLRRLLDEAQRTSRASLGRILLLDLKQGADRRIRFVLGTQLGNELHTYEEQVFERETPLLLNDLEAADYANTGERVRSALLVPIFYQDQVVGVIHLWSPAAGHFDREELDFSQALAVQASIALGNALRFQEQQQRNTLLNRRVQTLAQLMDLTRAPKLGMPLSESLNDIARAIREATPFDSVLFSVYRPENDRLERLAGVGFTPEQFSELQAHQQPWQSVQAYFLKEFQLGSAYFIPAERKPLDPPDVHILQILPEEPLTQDRNAWRPDDLCLIPLLDQEGQPLGLVSVDQPRDGLRPDWSTLESLEMFARQSARIIENIQVVSGLRSHLDQTRRQLARTQDSAEFNQAHLPDLLQKEQEQSKALQQFERQSRRLETGLSLVENIHRQNSTQELLFGLAEALIARLDFSRVLIVVWREGELQLEEGLGLDGIELTHLGALLGQRSPLRQALHTGTVIRVNDLLTASEWSESALLHALGAQAFVCLPFLCDAQPAAALLAVSQTALPDDAADQDLYETLTGQVSLALENLSAREETARRLSEVNLLLEFSQQLSGKEPHGILTVLLESALRVLSQASAGVVFLWDEIQQQLQPDAARGYLFNEKMLAIPYTAGQGLPGRTFREGQALIISEVEFARDYNLPPDKLVRYRDANAGKLPLACLVVPIQSGSKTWGVLLLDSFAEKNDFVQQDLALASSLAQQAALALDNARLYRAAEDRTRQLQALTQVAEHLSLTLQPDMLVESLLDQLKQVIPFDAGTLWLRQAELLTVKAVQGVTDQEIRLEHTTAVEDNPLLAELVASGEPAAVGNMSLDERFHDLPERSNTSWLGIPLLIQGEVIGVIALEKKEPDYYGADVVQIATTFASQASVALQNANLFDESLQRAIELDERTQRLSALSRFSSELSSSLEIERILAIVMRELLQSISCSSVSVVLFDRQQQPRLAGETLRTGQAFPQALPDTGFFDQMRGSLRPYLAQNVRQQDELSALAEHLERHGTQSLLALPVSTGAELLGILLVHQKRSDLEFTAEDIDLARTIANQSAISLLNARFYAETQQRMHELSVINQISQQVSQTIALDDLIASLPALLEPVVDTSNLYLALYDPLTDQLSFPLAFEAGIPQKIADRPPAGLTGHILQTRQPLLLVPDNIQEQMQAIGALTYGSLESIAYLGVPLLSGDQVTGVLAVQSSTQIYTQVDEFILSTIGAQIAIGIENSRLFSQVHSYADDLALRVADRTRQLSLEHQRSQTLLKIITELSGSLDMDIVLDRTLGLINEVIGAERSSIVLVDSTESGLGRYSSISDSGVAAHEQSLTKWVVAKQSPVLIEDLNQDQFWATDIFGPLDDRSALAVPLVVGQEALGALLLFHHKKGVFTKEHQELVKATAQQIAIAINNAKLFRLIRDQAERLGEMFRTQHVETSRSQAILEAVADGVLVTNRAGEITLLNRSAERILQLERAQVLSKSLEHFSGFFGRAARSWMETIRSWSLDASAYDPGEVYSEQINLEDGRVVSVNLSPVLLRNELLGTVSIFRDITHDVEVDRLKSEFVANVSHELRTPMTSIKGYIEILLMGAAGELSDTQKNFLGVVHSNTERLIILVNDLLEVSRLESGKLLFSPEPLELRQVVNQVMDEFRQRAQTEVKPMNFTMDFEPSLPRVYGDAERIRQIVNNLVDNAYHYTPAGGHIALRIFQAGGEIQVDVQDDGIGIPLAEQEAVFNRFYRGEDQLVLETPGTGLGLSVTQSLVEMHGGRIWLESQGIPGQGSTFSFTLPIYIPEEQTN